MTKPAPLYSIASDVGELENALSHAVPAVRTSRFAALRVLLLLFPLLARANAPAAAVNLEIKLSSYWGTGPAVSRTVAIDQDGNVYMAGGTSDTNWPITLGSPHTGGTFPDATVAKFDKNGTLIWSRLLGGPGEDYVYVSAVNDLGELYVGGRAGPGFPTTAGAFDRTFNGGVDEGPHGPTDGFVAKLGADGQLIYSTYIGGNGNDVVRAIYLLPSGKVIIAGGNSTSTDMPTDRGTLPGPVLKPKRGGSEDAYVAIVAANGASLDFCTYFGPSNDASPEEDEEIRGLGVDPQARIWIAGTTHGSDMVPTADAFQKTRGSALPTGEGYIAKLSIDGKQLVYFSWIGGNANDAIENEGISDALGNFYVAGSTASTNFPTTPGAIQSTLKGGGAGPFAGDGWVARVNANGSLGFATLYGGSTPGPESLFGPVVDAAGNVYATGRVRSTDCRTTADAYQKNKAGPPDSQDAVLLAFSPDGEELLYGTYFGGSGSEHGRHIGIDPDGTAVYLIGETNSTDLPIVGAGQRTVSEAYWAKFTLDSGTHTPSPTTESTRTATRRSSTPTRAVPTATPQSPTATSTVRTPTSPPPTSTVGIATVTAVLSTPTSTAPVATPPPGATATETRDATPPPGATATETRDATPAITPPPTDALAFCEADSPSTGLITITEVMTGISIALDILPMSVCPAIDLNHDGTVTVPDLVAAISVTLDRVALGPN